MTAFEEETMRLCCASISLLLLACTCVAQQHVPQTEVTVSREQVNQEQQNQPYEGRPIASLQFRGNQHFSSETIRDFMKTKEGDAYDPESLKVDLSQMRILLLAHGGYIKARYGKPEVEDTSGGLRIVVPIQEGILYRWGAIGIDGSTVFDADEILDIVGLKSGEIADGYVGEHVREKLNRLYRDRGYIRFDAEIIPDFKQSSADAEEGIVDITFKLEEGQVFRINTIRFEGNTRATDETLRRRLRIHEGDVYKEPLFSKSVERIFALGLYEEVSLLDQIDDQRNYVDITIRLKEKEHE
jgi:outer membrane protein insertion porin family